MMTYAEKLKEVLPKGDIEEIMKIMCPGDMFGTQEPAHYNSRCLGLNSPAAISVCIECWGREYREVKEDDI